MNTYIIFFIFFLWESQVFFSWLYSTMYSNINNFRENSECLINCMHSLIISTFHIFKLIITCPFLFRICISRFSPSISAETRIDLVASNVEVFCPIFRWNNLTLIYVNKTHLEMEISTEYFSISLFKIFLYLR